MVFILRFMLSIALRIHDELRYTLALCYHVNVLVVRYALNTLSKLLRSSSRRYRISLPILLALLVITIIELDAACTLTLMTTVHI